MTQQDIFKKDLKNTDFEIFNLIKKEKKRQKINVELIASENYVSKAVLEAQGSILTNKYSEGYPNKRYYGGCEVVDKIEQIAIDRAKELFNCDYANVQPHSGSQANFAVYSALLEPKDTILSLDLSNGGHLTHGSKVNFSGKIYNFIHYGLDENGFIDMENVRTLALEHKPKLILAGFSAYSRTLDLKAFKDIANEINAFFMVDIAHIAGLVATGIIDNPLNYADVVTTTTHKTLAGSRGGLILSKNKDEDFYRKLNSGVFPNAQGGALQHIIAGKAVCFKEALKPEFKEYMQKVVSNAQLMVKTLQEDGFKIVSGGTDNHMFLIDLTEFNLTGKEVEKCLDKVCITVNKNSIPNEKRSPFETSGIRIGTPAITRRGFTEEDIIKITNIIRCVILKMEFFKSLNSKELLPDNHAKVFKKEVKKITKKYKIY